MTYYKLNDIINLYHDLGFKTSIENMKKSITISVNHIYMMFYN